MDPSVHLRCPNCGKILGVPSAWLRETLRCKACGLGFRVKPASSLGAAGRDANKPRRLRRLGWMLTGVGLVGIGWLYFVPGNPPAFSPPQPQVQQAGESRPIALRDDVPLAAKSPNLDPAVPLPILASPLPERMASDDLAMPSLPAASLDEILRTAVVPFERINLPDPFEHKNTMRKMPPINDEISLPTGSARRRRMHCRGSRSVLV